LYFGISPPVRILVLEEPEGNGYLIIPHKTLPLTIVGLIFWYGIGFVFGLRYAGDDVTIDGSFVSQISTPDKSGGMLRIVNSVLIRAVLVFCIEATGSNNTCAIQIDPYYLRSRRL